MFSFQQEMEATSWPWTLQYWMMVLTPKGIAFAVSLDDVGLHIFVQDKYYDYTILSEMFSH